MENRYRIVISLILINLTIFGIVIQNCELEYNSNVPASSQLTTLNYGDFFDFGYDEMKINAYNTTAYHNWSAYGFQLSDSTPYSLESEIISENLLFADYFVTHGNISVYVNLPSGTSIELYLSNNYFLTEKKVNNNTLVEFSEFGRQFAYKIILRTSNTANSPTIFSVMVNCTGIPYNETDFTYDMVDSADTECVNNDDLLLGTMDFIFDSNNIVYEAEFSFYMEKINSTHDWIEGEITISAETEKYVTNQNNHLEYDYNFSINGVDFRLYGLKSFSTSFISFGHLGDFTFFNITIEHEECEAIKIENSIKYKIWNGDGGLLQGVKEFESIICTNRCKKSIPFSTFGVVISLLSSVSIAFLILKKRFVFNFN